MNQVHSTHLFSLWELSMKLLHHIHLLLMVWLKKKNRTLIKLTNVMLIEFGAPLHFWGDTILTACHVFNRVPHKRSHITPFEMWKGHLSNLEYLRVWACLKYVRLTDSKMPKLGIKATTCSFLGYAINSAAY